LRPPILASRGLDAALSAVASRLRVPVEIQVDVGRLEPTIEAVLYFAMTECLTNIAKHAPGAHATVGVSRAGRTATAVVSDDGPGGATLAGGSGLAGIADRLAGVDGRLWLSSPPGGPTVVRLEVPCES
jgi:signal transduction histidine kinase